MKNIIIFTMMFIVVSVVSVTGAQIENSQYSSVGGGGFYNDYFQWVGDWNTDTSGELLIPSATSNIQYTPIVGDVNKDGFKEIITVDSSGSFKIWNRTYDNRLSVIGGWVETSTIQAPPIIFDIDRDGNKEIIYSTNNNIEIYRFADNLVTNPSEHDISASFGDYSDGEAVLMCRESNECLWVGAENDGREFDGDNSLRAYSFSYSQIEAGIVLESSSSSNNFYCLSDIASMPVADIELDSSKRFVVSAMEVDITSNDQIHVYSVWMNSTNVSDIRIDHELSNVNRQGYSNLQTCGLGDYGKFFTSPITINFDNAYAGDEVFMGYSTGSDEWEITYYSSVLQDIGIIPCDGDDADESPTEGERSSNLYVCRLFPDSIPNFDVCMNVYSQANDEMSIIVYGNPDNTGYATDRCEDTEYDTDYDLSYDNPYTLIAHSGTYQGQTAGSVEESDVYEPLSPYGVMKVNWGFFLFGVINDMKELENTYVSPFHNTTLIADGVTGSEDDLIGYNPERLFLIDDNIIDQNAYVSAWEWNPCITDVWQQNTTAEVQMTIRDGDTVSLPELVQGRVIWYYPAEEQEVYGEATLIYNSLLNESESDGLAETSQFAFGVSATNGNISSYSLIKDAPTGTLNRFRMEVDGISGDPGEADLIYNFYACQTTASSLSTNPKSQCLTAPQIAKSNFDLSNQWGNTAGWKTVDLDGAFPMQESYSYIVWAEFVSGGDGGNDYYTLATDDNGITNNYMVIDFEGGTNLTYSELPDFEMWYIPQSSQIYDSGWSAELSSGGVFTHSITVNQKVSNGVIRLMARDTEHLNDYTYKDFNFNVAESGIEYGQTTCGGSQTAEGGLLTDGEGGVLTDNDVDVQDNSIKDTMDVLTDELGFKGFSYTTLWFLFMFLVGIAIWFAPINDSVENQGVLKLGAMLISELVLLFLGMKFAFIGLGTIIIVSIVGLAVVVISFRRSAVGG